MTVNPQEVVSKYKALLQENNNLQQSQWASISINGGEIQNATVLTNKTTSITQRRKKLKLEEIPLSSFIGYGSGNIAGLSGTNLSTLTEINDFPSALYVGQIRKIGSDYDYYAVYTKQTDESLNLYTLRFSHIVNNEEEDFIELDEIPLNYTTDVVSEPFKEYFTTKSFTPLGVVDGFYLFSIYEVLSVSNYEDPSNSILIGFKDSILTNTSVGFVNLNTNTSNKEFSIVPDIFIDINSENAYAVFAEITVPMPSPINSVDGRYVIFHNSLDNPSQRVIIGTNDTVIAKNGIYLFIANYRDFNLRFYTNTSYISVPTSFLDYDLSSLPERTKGIFGNPQTSIQILDDGTILRLLGITENNILLYITRKIDDPQWSPVQELEVPNFDPPITVYDVGYIEL